MLNCLRNSRQHQWAITSDEARQRLTRYGSNLLTPRKRSDSLALFLMGLIVAFYIISAEIVKAIFYRRIKF